MDVTCKRDGCIDNKRHRSPYCSNACKQADHRAKCNTPSVTDVTVTHTEPVTLTADEATAMGNGSEFSIGGSDGKHYAERANPDTLNTGEYMTANQLKAAGLKANRLPIPGDHDYKGVCEQVDGVWQVRAA